MIAAFSNEWCDSISVWPFTTNTYLRKKLKQQKTIPDRINDTNCSSPPVCRQKRQYFSVCIKIVLVRLNEYQMPHHIFQLYQRDAARYIVILWPKLQLLHHSQKNMFDSRLTVCRTLLLRSYIKIRTSIKYKKTICNGTIKNRDRAWNETKHITFSANVSRMKIEIPKWILSIRIHWNKNASNTQVDARKLFAAR